MLKKCLILIALFMLSTGQYVGAKEIMLSEIRNVYPEIEFKFFQQPIQAEEDKGRSVFLPLIEEGLKGLGYSIVNDPKLADLKAVFHVENALSGLGNDWSFDKVWIDLKTTDTDFFITRINIKSDYWPKPGFLTLLKHRLFKQLKKIVEEDETRYKIATSDELEEIKKITAIKLPERFETIFKDRPAYKIIKNASYPTVGLLVLPIWGEGQLWGSGSPLTFAYWFEKPMKKDKFIDIKTRDNKKGHSVGSIKLYLFTEISKEDFPPVVSTNGTVVYYRDDFRDIIVSAFSNAFEPFDINLKELRMEKYQNDILTNEMKDVLEKIASEHPELDLIFVSYYIPFSEWFDLQTAGNRMYAFPKSGLFLSMGTSCFDLKKKYKRLIDFKVEIKNADPMVVTTSFNKVETILEEKIKKELKKKRKSLKMEEFTSTKNQNSMLYIKNRDTAVKNDAGMEIAKLNQKVPIELEEKISPTKWSIIIDAYVDADKVEKIGDSKIVPQGEETLLRRNIVFKNRYGHSNLISGEILGKFIDKTATKLTIPFQKNLLSDRHYKIKLRGYVNANDVVSDKKIFKEKGTIKGRLVKAGNPLSSTELYIKPAAKKKKVTTNKNGNFKFEGVKPAFAHNIYILEDKENIYRYKIDNLAHKLRLNPAEVLDLGDIILDDSNIIDTYAEIEDVKKRIEAIEPGVFTKQHVILYLGEPTNRYSNEIWGFKYKENSEIFAFFEDDKVKSMGYISKEK